MTIRTNAENSVFQLDDSTYETTYKKKRKTYIFCLRTRLKTVMPSHPTLRRYVPDTDDNGREVLVLHDVHKLVHSSESIQMTTTDRIPNCVWDMYTELLCK